MMRGTTLADLLQGHGYSRKDPTPITKGLKREKYPTDTEGYRIATPEQLASILVPVQEIVEGEIIGFQRPLDVRRARRIADALRRDEPMATIEIALHGNAAWATDGQHRAAGAIIARMPVPTLARHLDEKKMKALFASQAKASNVNASTLVLSASDPFSEYVQDAVTSQDHPWSWLVSYTVSSKSKLTPSQMRGIVGSYVTGTMTQWGSKGAAQVERKFDRERADELAEIVGAFGGKEANRPAYRVHALRAMTYAAVLIIRRHHHDDPSAITRWTKHMPKFRFDRYLAVNSAQEMVPLLIAHWNKRLDGDQRVPMSVD